MGVPEQDVATPLYDAVDTDALERLLSRDAAGRHPTEVSFEYAGYRVTARSDGTVAVE